MRIPGDIRKGLPDECGARAGEFVQMVRENQMWFAWHRMSKESQGMWEGIWLTRKRFRAVDIYKEIGGYTEATFRPLLDDLRAGLFIDWGLENLTNLGVAPTRYLDDYRALVPLIIGVSEVTLISKPTVLPQITIPMILEDKQWNFHFPGYGWLS